MPSLKSPYSANMPDLSELVDSRDEEGNLVLTRPRIPTAAPMPEEPEPEGPPSVGDIADQPGLGNKTSPRENPKVAIPQKPSPEARMGGMGGRATPSRPKEPTPIAGQPPAPTIVPPPSQQGGGMGPSAAPPMAPSAGPSQNPFPSPTPRELVGSPARQRGMMLGSEGGLLGGGLGAPEAAAGESDPTDLLLLLTQLLGQ